jgi:hypothetical protein
LDWIKVSGDSMRPFILSGDYIGVDWVDAEDVSPKVGELVLGKNEGEEGWLVHRMVASSSKSPRQFVIKGDASYVSEEFSRSQIWGRVVAFRKKSSGTEHSLGVNAVDRVIAWCSVREWRRAVFLFGFLRRKIS